MLYAQRVILVTAAAAACYGLAAVYDTWPGLLLWAGVTAVGCVLGAVLLRTSRIGEITWKNRAAGYLIPWGWRLNRGLLWPVPVISWLTWVAIGGGSVLLRPDVVDEAPGAGVRIALFASWTIDAAALIFLLGTIRQATPGGRVRSLWKLVAVIAGLIGASVGLYLGGLPTAALVVGGGPPLLLSACLGLVVLLFSTVGRNTRWN